MGCAMIHQLMMALREGKTDNGVLISLTDSVFSVFLHLLNIVKRCACKLNSRYLSDDTDVKFSPSQSPLATKRTTKDG